MTYLEAVEVIRQIEAKYDVMSIRYKGISVWPHLRLYLHDKISINTEVKASGSVIKIVLRSLFAYNPLQFWKRHKIWLLTGCERRKKIGDKMVHRISGGISTNIPSCMMVEKPSSRVGHYPKENIEEKSIVSESWLLLSFHLIERLLRLSKPKIENEQIIQHILSDYGLSFDYRHSVRMLNAKRLAMLWLMRITRKPKLAIMECPYVSMGYMWAFHQKGVKVIELQHGVLNRNHNAYNAKAYEPRINPDAICVYGSEEFAYFTKEEPQYANDVYLTGLYMLEKSDESFRSDIFKDDRCNYKAIIVVSGQNGYENQMAEMIDTAALNHPEILFFYIPRLIDTVLEFKAPNVKLKREVNIYEYLKWADIHITMYSTTCMEAQFFQTPTIFYDYEHRSSTYYGHILKQENGCVYINNAQEFDHAYQLLKQGSFCFKEVFVHNHVDRIKKIINDYI